MTGVPAAAAILMPLFMIFAVSTFLPLISVVIDSGPNFATTFPFTGQIKRFLSRLDLPRAAVSSRLFAGRSAASPAGRLFGDPAGGHIPFRRAGKGGTILRRRFGRHPLAPRSSPSAAALLRGLLSGNRGRRRRFRFPRPAAPPRRVPTGLPPEAGFRQDVVENLARIGDEDDAARRDLVGHCRCY